MLTINSHANATVCCSAVWSVGHLFSSHVLKYSLRFEVLDNASELVGYSNIQLKVKKDYLILFTDDKKLILRGIHSYNGCVILQNN